MKLCFSTLSCPNWSLNQILSACQTCDIHGVDFRGLGSEIDITKLPLFTSELDSTLEALRARNVSMPCLNTSITLVTPAPDRWQMMLDECHRYAQLAGRAGTDFLRIFGGGIPKDLSRDEAVQLARRHLRQLTKVCRPHGCQVLLETHDDWSVSSDVLDLVGEFSPDDVGVLYDVEHPHRHGQPPEETVAALNSYILHVHLKDSVNGGANYAPKLMGEGDLPLKRALAALKSQNYSGWYCLEAEKRWHPAAPDPEVSIPQFARYMRELSV